METMAESCNGNKTIKLNNSNYQEWNSKLSCY